MKNNIGISGPDQQTTGSELAKVLADEYVLYTKTRNAHWNVEGPSFHGLHLFFEEQLGQPDELIDSVAERIRAPGHYAPGSIKTLLELTRLSEYNGEGNSGAVYMAYLLEDHRSIIFTLRENIDRFAAQYKDYGSSDFLTGLITVHEKMA